MACCQEFLMLNTIRLSTIRLSTIRLRNIFTKSLTFVSVVAILATGTIAPLTTVAAPTPVASPAPVKLTSTQRAIAKLKQSPDHWIEVNLTTQRVIAWEGKRWVNAMIVSTGKDSTPTVTGVFEVYDRYRETRMQGADYDIPDVPYVMYFYEGYGFHGTYWHNRFGTPVSHGCVNLAVDKAKWLYDFATIGTPVVVHY
jgi:lipoprotein-anchoring transpeptidase ErfK/SrfK